MASSDFSRHIASDFPFRVILPLLCTICRIPGRGLGDGVRPPQFLQVLCRHSTTPTPGKDGPALPESPGRLRSSPTLLGFDLPVITALRRSSIRFMLRTADLLSLSGFTYRFDTEITSIAGYMLHGFPVFTTAGLSPASTCRLIWAHRGWAVRRRGGELPLLWFYTPRREAAVTKSCRNHRTAF